MLNNCMKLVWRTQRVALMAGRTLWRMKEMVYEVRCLKLNADTVWSSHLLDNLSNCLMNLKNSGDSMGFKPMTSAMPLQCSNQLSYEVTQLRAGQFVGLMQVRGSYLHLISNTALHVTFLSYDIPFTGKHEPNKLTSSQLCDFVAQLVRALHRHCRGHGFEPRWVTWIFQVHETIA